MFDGATTSVHSNLAIGRVCGDHREIMAVVSPTATDDDVWRVVNLKSKGSDTDQFDSIAVLGAIDDDQAVEWAFNQRGRFLLDSIVLSVGETNTPGLKRYLDSERLNYRANSQIHLNQLSKLQDMTTGQPVMWDGVNLKSHSNSSAVLLVDLVKHDDNSQLFDAIKADDMPALLELLGAEAMGYDALIVESRKLDTLMQRLGTAMSKATQSGVTVTNVRQSEPFKRNKVTQVAAIFEMSDGQSVSIVFHNPDSTPSKLLPQDTLISWKFLLNSRDISAAVQPNQGEDVQLPVLATRVMKLVNQNSARFARTNAKKAENVAALDEAKARIETKSQTVASLDVEIAQLQAELDKPVEVPEPIPAVEPEPQLSTRAEVFKILTSDYGWSESRISGGIEKTFSGLGASGQMSDGSRTLSANFDSKERYLAVTDNTAPTGGAIIPSTEIDARIGGYTPDGFIITAKAFNDAVEDYVLDERNKLLPEPTLTKTDMGNGESLVEGMAENRDGTFTALTLVDSKTFKTRAGAERWLAQRGLNPDGTRMAKPEPTESIDTLASQKDLRASAKALETKIESAKSREAALSLAAAAVQKDPEMQKYALSALQSYVVAQNRENYILDFPKPPPKKYRSDQDISKDVARLNKALANTPYGISGRGYNSSISFKINDQNLRKYIDFSIMRDESNETSDYKVVGVRPYWLADAIAKWFGGDEIKGLVSDAKESKWVRFNIEGTLLGAVRELTGDDSSTSNPDPVPTPEEAPMPATNPDAEYLQSIVDGTADLSVAGDELERIGDNLPPELEALFEEAAEAYAQYAIGLEV